MAEVTLAESSRSEQRAAPDWDALAPYWHCFERHGLDQRIVGTVLSCLVTPVLYVGGGRGTYASRVQRWLGRENVVIVDASLAMARRARTDFGLEYVRADVRAVPSPSGAFGSAVCATGVFEYMDQNDQVRSLVELRRACRPGAPIVVVAFVATAASAHRSVDQGGHVGLDRWFRHDDGPPSPDRRVASVFGAVAKELGNREAAYHLLRRCLPPSGGFVVPNEFAASVAAAGLASDPPVVDRGVAVWYLR